jgi:glycosyltransferase involved in cell wall biosynthesis
MGQLVVAFAQMGTDWQGGQTLVANAIRALHQVQPSATRLYVLGDASPTTEAYRRTTGADAVVEYTPPAWSSIRRVAGAAWIRWKAHNLALERALLEYGVHVLISESVAWQLGKVASVGWLQDFQHVHLRQLFSRQELARRDRKFRLTMRLADCLLATRSVERDARSFAPVYASKIRVIHQLSLIDSSIYVRDPGVVCEKYSLPKKFFYFPGQFWLHKNHRRLFEALNLLSGRGVRPQVVLTGSTLEYRDPDYFPGLMQYVVDHNLTDQVHYLGSVPRAEVFDLIRQSLCVVNPSLFEGWGYAVDEAASVGKRILASDIAAHRDQGAPACEYFDACSTEALADALAQVWEHAEPGADARLEALARARAPQRVEAFGTALYDTLREAVQARQGQRELAR